MKLESEKTQWPKDIPAKGRLDEAQALGLFAALGVPVVGPLVLVGAGGTLAELYNDVVLREAEANPLIVKRDGVVAVDALAVMKEE